MGSLVGFFHFCCVCCFLVHWKALLSIKTSGFLFGLALGFYLPLAKIPLVPEKWVLWLEFFTFWCVSIFLVWFFCNLLLSIFALGSSLTGSCFPYQV